MKLGDNKEKIFFYLSTILYLISVFSVNLISKGEKIIETVQVQLDTENSKMIFILTSTIISVFILLIILVIARALLVVVYRVIYKENKKELVSMTFYIAVGIKLIMMTIAQLVMFADYSMPTLIINIVPVIVYCVYIALSNKTISKDSIIKMICGSLLIVFV